MRCGVLIPAYEPGEALPALTRTLMDKGVPVVVVNDGSATGLEYFERIRAQGAVVLEHGENLGKGRALKTGLAWMAEQGYEGVVTADADGQHSLEDILRQPQAGPGHPGRLPDAEPLKNGQPSDPDPLPASLRHQAPGHPDRPAGHPPHRGEPVVTAEPDRRAVRI